VEIGEIFGVSDAAARSRIRQGARHLARAALLWRRPRS
jgi:DNA-directed RNA polymerase specialized sigma24 family protein